MNRLTKIAILIALVLWPAAARAQSEALMQAYRQGQALFQAGRYGEAIGFHERALALAELEFGLEHATTATLLNDLAELYRARGRYAEAEPLYKRALAIYEQALGPDHPYVATSLNNLALLYDDQGRGPEAEALYKRSLGILEQAHGSDHPHVAASLNNLAELYRVQGRIAEAGPLYERALGIKEKALGSDHPDVVASLNNLARLYESQGRAAEAEALYARALESARAAGETRLPGPAASPRPNTYVTVKNANVRATPATDGARLMTLAKGTEVELLEGVAGDTWYRVAQGGRPIGFIHAALLAPRDAGAARSPGPAASPRPNTYVTLKNANVRATPATDGARLMTLAKGTEVELLEGVAGDTWYRVAQGGRPIGFIHAALLAPRDAGDGG